jgi:tetratricopeptide (TPR) repeat protein
MAISVSDTVKDWIAGKKVLICASNGTDRTAWKKLSVDVGVPVNMIETSEDFEQSVEKLEKEKYQIVFCSNEIKGGSGLDLIKKHKEVVVNRGHAMFFLFSNKNSMAIACAAAEEEVDAFLIKPYNIQDLQDNVVKAFEGKSQLSDFEKDMFDVDELIHEGKIDEAKELIEKGKKTKPMNASPVFFEANLLDRDGKTAEACEVYDTAVGLDDDHFRSLRFGFAADFKTKRYNQAYDKLHSLLDNFPVNPNRIPDYIRISIATQNFDNIVDFCEKILDLNEELGPDIEVPIAAGLVMSGKFLAQKGSTDNASEVALKAIQFAHGKEMIISSSLSIFNLIGDKQSGIEVYEGLDEKIQSLPLVKAVLEDLREG